MTLGEGDGLVGRDGAPWWRVPPRQQISWLDADPELLRIAFDPLPVGAPAVLQFFPSALRPGVLRPSTLLPSTLRPGGPNPPSSPTDLIDDLLATLEQAAIGVFPSWLPGAESLDDSLGIGVPAVRALASQLASRSRHFGPFLAALAECALAARSAADPPADLPAGRWGDPPAGALFATRARAVMGQFPAGVRAAGLIRVLAAAYQRMFVVVLIEVPEGLTAIEEHALVAAAGWLVQHGPATVWLVGAPMRADDRVHTVTLTLPESVTDLVAPGEDVPPVGVPTINFPPMAGSPRADSAAERALERALASHDWAAGRQWNQTYEWHLLGKPYRLDLFWPAEGLVVEVDGPEHRGRSQYADDRRRDTRLQLLGHDVLRFTNEEVCADVSAVVSMIGELLRLRRARGGTAYREHDEKPHRAHDGK